MTVNLYILLPSGPQEGKCDALQAGSLFILQLMRNRPFRETMSGGFQFLKDSYISSFAF